MTCLLLPWKGPQNRMIRGTVRSEELGRGCNLPQKTPPIILVVRVSPKIARDCRSLNIKPVDAS